MTSKPFFTTARERRLWLWALALVAAIYATLGLARSLVGLLSEEALANGFWLGLFLLMAAVVTMGLRVRLRGAELGVALGIAGAYLILFLRMSIPAERSHLIEYSAVALLIYEALKERAGHGRTVRAPALIAIGATVLVGTIDEGIQRLLPSRTFDVIDILFDAVAAALAVTGSAALSWARRRRRARAGPAPGR